MIVALIQGCASTTTSAPTVKSSASAVSQSTNYIYLAEPEVFLPDPIGAGITKKADFIAANMACSEVQAWT
jgi:hypothetical protein